MKKRVLITGAYGQDGSYLSEIYHAENAEIHGVCRTALSAKSKMIKDETLKRIADYFDTSIDFLVGFSSERRKTGLSNSQDISRQESSLIRKYRILTPKEKQSIDLILENYLNK